MNDKPRVFFRVHYTDSFASGRYGVFRAFDTQAKAQEFIDNNALVFPLPDCRLVHAAILDGAIVECDCDDDDCLVLNA